MKRHIYGLLLIFLAFSIVVGAKVIEVNSLKKSLSPQERFEEMIRTTNSQLPKEMDENTIWMSVSGDYDEQEASYYFMVRPELSDIYNNYPEERELIKQAVTDEACTVKDPKMFLFSRLFNIQLIKMRFADINDQYLFTLYLECYKP